MSWYIASRRLRELVLVSEVAALLAAAASGMVLFLPGLVPGPQLGLPAALLLPSLCSAAAVAVFAAVPRPAEVASPRPIAVLDHAAVLTVVGLAAVTFVLAGAVGNAAQLFGSARNVAAFAGIALCFRPLVRDRYVVVVPVAATFAIAALGAPVRDEAWFWFLRAASTSSSAAAGALLAGGLLVSIIGSRRRSAAGSE